MAQLRDLGSEEFETAVAGDFPVKATDCWLVLIDSGKPVSALPPGSVLATTTPFPPIIVASANLDLGAALASPAFAQTEDIRAVVLVEEQRVIGVWGGPRLKMVIARGLVPSRGGPVLPGVPQIPWIVRSCSYREVEAICATVESFPSKPFPMPNCRNDHQLSAHVFDW
jgi:hypothetical protein